MIKRMKWLSCMLVFISGVLLSQSDNETKKQAEFITGAGIKTMQHYQHFSAYGGISVRLHWKCFELGYSALVGTSLPVANDIRVTAGIGQLAVPYILSNFKEDPKLVIYGAFIGLILPEQFNLNIPLNKNNALQLYAQPYSAIYSYNQSDTLKKERVEIYGEMGLRYRIVFKDPHSVDLALGIYSYYSRKAVGISFGLYYNRLHSKHRRVSTK